MFEIFLGVYIIGFLIHWPLYARSLFFGDNKEQAKKDFGDDSKILRCIVGGFIISFVWIILTPSILTMGALKYLFFPEAIRKKKK